MVREVDLEGCVNDSILTRGVRLTIGSGDVVVSRCHDAQRSPRTLTSIILRHSRDHTLVVWVL